MPGNKLYVVTYGSKTGFFTSWDECSPHVSKFSGAIFKSFQKQDASHIAEWIKRNTRSGQEARFLAPENLKLIEDFENGKPIQTRLVDLSSSSSKASLSPSPPSPLSTANSLQRSNSGTVISSMPLRKSPLMNSTLASHLQSSPSKISYTSAPFTNISRPPTNFVGSTGLKTVAPPPTKFSNPTLLPKHTPSGTQPVAGYATSSKKQSGISNTTQKSQPAPASSTLKPQVFKPRTSKSTVTPKPEVAVKKESIKKEDPIKSEIDQSSPQEELEWLAVKKSSKKSASENKKSLPLKIEQPIDEPRVIRRKKRVSLKEEHFYFPDSEMHASTPPPKRSPRQSPKKISWKFSEKFDQ